MTNLLINMFFLYFPEDKTEYIPGVAIVTLFMSFAVVAVYLVIKKSKKDEEEFNKKYADQIKKAKDAGKQRHQHS